VKPNVVEAPAPTEPLYDALVTVTAPLLADGTPLHRLEMLAPDGRLSATLQREIALLPAVIVTVPWNPPGQAFTAVYVALQAPVGGGGVVELGGGGVVELGGGGVVELGGGGVVETGGAPFSALRTDVYAAFLLPLPSKSSGVSPERQESLSRTPHTVMPTQRETARQSLTMLA